MVHLRESRNRDLDPKIKNDLGLEMTKKAKRKRTNNKGALPPPPHLDLVINEDHMKERDQLKEVDHGNAKNISRKLTKLTNLRIIRFLWRYQCPLSPLKFKCLHFLAKEEEGSVQDLL